MCDGFVGDFELLDRWEEFMIAEAKSPITISKYTYVIVKFASKMKPRKALRAVTEEDVAAFLGWQKSATAKQLYLMSLRSFYRWASERGHVPVDPTAKLHPRGPAERDADAFSTEEVGRVMAAAGGRPKLGDRDALAIQLAYALGLRRSEVCKLSPDDIDWTGERVFIRESKGGKSRFVEMNDIAADALERLRPWWNGTVLGSVSPNQFTMIVHDAAKRAGLPPGRRNSHLLRAAFVTNLMDAGADPFVVAKLVGHTKVTTTMRYRLIRSANRRDTVSKLPGPVPVP